VKITRGNFLPLHGAFDSNKDLKDSINKEFENFSKKIQEFNLNMLDPRDNLTHFNNLKFNIYDKLGKELEKIQARTADEQLLEIFNLPDDNAENTFANVEKSRKSSYNTIKKVIKYLENIDEETFKKMVFSKSIINILQKKLKIEIFQGYVVNKDTTDISNKLNDFCQLLLDKTDKNEKKYFLEELEKIAKSLDLIKEAEENIPRNFCCNPIIKKVKADNIYRIETNKDQDQSSVGNG
jgi:hypothetical protein